MPEAMEPDAPKPLCISIRSLDALFARRGESLIFDTETLIFNAMSNFKISITPDSAHALTFDVIVDDGRGESRHRVAMKADEAERWSKLDVAPLHCVEAAMRFLLDREPKESILSAFDIGVIRRYFPEFDDALPDYLSRLDSQPRSGA